MVFEDLGTADFFFPPHLAGAFFFCRQKKGKWHGTRQQTAIKETTVLPLPIKNEPAGREYPGGIHLSF